MKIKRLLPVLLTALTCTTALVSVTAHAADAISAVDKLNAFGPEANALLERVGTWDVTITSWQGPEAEPVVLKGLVAERRMIGPMLEELLQPVKGTPGAAFSRADFLTFNRMEGRWQYMSMDSRVPDGMMTAYSLNADPEQRVFMSFLPFASPSVTQAGVVGQLWRMEQVIRREDADHEVKEQYFTAAGSEPLKWLGNRYSYTRRK